MREIKFRIWDKKLNRFRADTKELAISLEGEVLRIPAINDCLEGWSTDLENQEISQYTGLKDKNGKEIYEGDIIMSDESGPFIIKWFDCLHWDSGGSCAIGFYLEAVNRKDSWLEYGELDYHTRLAINPQYLEVLGNIYENPELLEK